MIFGRFGPFELILVLAIALLIFGPKKIPEIGKAIGKTIKEFKKGTTAEEDEDQTDDLVETDPELLEDEKQETVKPRSRKKAEKKKS